MPQLRQNIITGDWVVIAPERSKRPSDFIAAEAIKDESKLHCPFCSNGAAYKTMLKDFETNEVYVFPNKYPAFLQDPKHSSARAYRLEGRFYNARPSTGGHDVLAMKNHELQLYTFDQKVWEELLHMAKRRYTYWRHECNTEYSMLIYNQGIKAGASIHHPHAQLLASSIIPNLVSAELHGAERYFEDNGSCVFCDLIEHEIAQNVRVIAKNDHFIAFTFYAARFPFEVWVMPLNHEAHFENMKDDLIKPMAEIMRQVATMIGDTLHQPSLNFFLHDLPTTIDRADYYHWHIEFTPRVSTYGGFELGAGTVIDIIAPEDAAKFLTKQLN